MKKPFVLLFFIIIISFLGWVFWSIVSVEQIISFEPNPIKIQNKDKRIARGEDVNISLSYCKNVDKFGEVSLDIENSAQLFILPSRVEKLPVGCHNDAVLLTTVPASLPIEATSGAGAGTARVRVTITYQANFFRTAVYTFKTENFTITP